MRISGGKATGSEPFGRCRKLGSRLPRWTAARRGEKVAVLMTRLRFPAEVDGLVGALKRLPGIGPRSASRIAVWLLQQGRAEALEGLSRALEAVEVVRLCPDCGFFASETAPPCAACDPQLRDQHAVCVVEQPTEVLALEQTGQFHGRYHCLGGRLAPLDDIGPEQLRLRPLLDLLRRGEVRELILATGADVEGEATASWLAELARSLLPDLAITRLAQGLPAGAGLEAADPLTLLRALSGRRGFGE